MLQTQIWLRMLKTKSISSGTEKARLIWTDPVTCAKNFDYKYREVLKLMKKPGGIFGSNFVTWLMAS